MEDFFLVILGVFISVVATYVELRHKTIWHRSLSNYKRPSSNLIHALIRPSLTAYRINVFIIWPVVFILGMGAICEGFNYTNFITTKMANPITTDSKTVR